MDRSPIMYMIVPRKKEEVKFVSKVVEKDKT